jgi:hypothetical protein
MASNAPETLRELIRLLKSDELKDRLTAIMALGEIGDEVALRALRERMVPVNEELGALVVAGSVSRSSFGVWDAVLWGMALAPETI